MPDLARRFETNPVLRPADVKPSRPDMQIVCLLNPGVFRYQGRTGLLLRVAERPKQDEGFISMPIADATSPGGVRSLRFDKSDPKLNLADPRIIQYDGV